MERVKNLKVPEPLHRRLKMEASRVGISLSAYVLDILWAAVRSVKENRKTK
jgi:predicted HicB family RNase H-like nuclease